MSDMETNTEALEKPSWVRAMLIGRKPKRTLIRIFVLVVSCFIVFKFILLPIRVEGGSMLPTYKEHGVNFLNRQAYLFHEPRPGDVVGIRLAGHSIMFLKRIIALPGETIAFHQGHVLINGKILDEPYVKLQCDWERPPVTLQPGHYFVVGDNRSMPMEDHEMGEAARTRIVGKILL